MGENQNYNSYQNYVIWSKWWNRIHVAANQGFDDDVDQIYVIF